MTAQILLVENDERLLDIMKFYLEGAGYEVAAYRDPVAAVESLPQRRYALVILDVAVPRMDGYQVAKEVRVSNLNRESPILFVSGKVEVPAALERESGGKIQFMKKPIAKKEFLDKVAELTGGTH
jgi:DNA-binding response OmpR family regulator